MPEDTWKAVDEYFAGALLPADDALTFALERSAAAGLPAIAVSALQGNMLHLLAHLRGAQRILEIGTLGGYSTIWLARALPANGHLITLEYEPKHAAVARDNVARAGLTSIVDIRVGAALASLQALHDEGVEPFDFIFVDADKKSSPEYFEWALRFSRKGTLIIVDNVVRDGAVLDTSSESADIRGVRRFIDALGSESRVNATAIQTVGSKGYDGFAMILVR